LDLRLELRDLARHDLLGKVGHHRLGVAALSVRARPQRLDGQRVHGRPRLGLRRQVRRHLLHPGGSGLGSRRTPGALDRGLQLLVQRNQERTAAQLVEMRADHRGQL